MQKVYSHSRLSCFEQCPKRFHFRYVLRIPVETESIEAFLGRRVHAVLERLYRFVARRQIPSLERVLRRFRLDWEEQLDPERVRVVRSGATPDSYRELGERCLRNHYRAHYPFDGDETLGLEEKVLFALDGDGRYRMQGFIDRLVRARDGAIEIHDYKTGQRLPDRSRLDRDRQLALYQLGIQERFGDSVPVRLVWHYLAFSQSLVSTRSAEELDALREETIALIDRIESESRFEARPGPLCGWCEFRDRCPEGGNGSRAEGAGAAAHAEPAVEEKPPPPGPEVLEPPEIAGETLDDQLSLL